jgi:hypothetical protein
MEKEKYGEGSGDGEGKEVKRNKKRLYNEVFILQRYFYFLYFPSRKLFPVFESKAK